MPPSSAGVRRMFGLPLLRRPAIHSNALWTRPAGASGQSTAPVDRCWFSTKCGRHSALIASSVPPTLHGQLGTTRMLADRHERTPSARLTTPWGSTFRAAGRVRACRNGRMIHIADSSHSRISRWGISLEAGRAAGRARTLKIRTTRADTHPEAGMSHRGRMGTASMGPACAHHRVEGWLRDGGGESSASG